MQTEPEGSLLSEGSGRARRGLPQDLSIRTADLRLEGIKGNRTRSGRGSVFPQVDSPGDQQSGDRGDQRVKRNEAGSEGALIRFYIEQYI